MKLEVSPAAAKSNVHRNKDLAGGHAASDVSIMHHFTRIRYFQELQKLHKTSCGICPQTMYQQDTVSAAACTRLGGKTDA